tara:strand:+ start:507 stop:1214 length:708 start_codon:yes stop_codon:yes gene_type:complete
MIEITDILRPIEQGATNPFLCLADDGKSYVVKGQATTNRQLIAEFISAHLARLFGLPVPQFETAYIDHLLLRYNDAASNSLGEGVAFASEFIEGLQPITYQLLTNQGKSLASELFIFDLWVRNEDRTLSAIGGNPNLFYQPAETKFWALDHNLAFDMNFKLDEFKSSHLGSDAWIEQRNLLSKDYFQSKANSCIDKIDQIFKEVPKDWEPSDDYFSQIRLILDQIFEDSFWRQIT